MDLKSSIIEKILKFDFMICKRTSRMVKMPHLSINYLSPKYINATKMKKKHNGGLFSVVKVSLML